MKMKTIIFNNVMDGFHRVMDDAIKLIAIALLIGSVVVGTALVNASAPNIKAADAFLPKDANIVKRMFARAFLPMKIHNVGPIRIATSEWKDAGARTAVAFGGCWVEIPGGFFAGHDNNAVAMRD